MMAALGLHKDPWHDTGAAVVWRENGDRKIVQVNEERLDRVKNSRAFPEQATRACLDEAGLTTPREADLVVLDYRFDDRHWSLDRRGAECRSDVFLAGIPDDQIVQVRHHLCHAASCFFTSPFDKAAILIVDGFGSAFETQTIWLGEQSSIELVEESREPGIGLFYEAVTRVIGFEFLEAGKTMGLAPFGRQVPGPVLQFERRFHGVETSYKEEIDFEPRLLRYAGLVLDESQRARAAYDVQRECERAILHLAEYARRLTGADKLCLSGGVGLNCVANTVLVAARKFPHVFINPACSDAGIALGAALWGYHGLLGQARCVEAVSPFLGPTYDKARVDAAIPGIAARQITENIIEATVGLLLQDRVVAVFTGRSEMGPRALGHRSLLMNPGRVKNRERLNRIVKRREPFRPFAPCVPLYDAGRYFAMDGPSPHMLFVADVRREWRSRLPAVTHVDGTARVQTVEPLAVPLLHTILIAFGRATGVPVLINTSFNVTGEPMVESPEDAVRSFMSADIDALLIEDVLFYKP